MHKLRNQKFPEVFT